MGRWSADDWVGVMLAGMLFVIALGVIIGALVSELVPLFMCKG